MGLLAESGGAMKTKAKITNDCDILLVTSSILSSKLAAKTTSGSLDLPNFYATVSRSRKCTGRQKIFALSFSCLDTFGKLMLATLVTSSNSI